MSEEVDFIIIGQGLAGSVLSLKLLERGYSVKVIDQPSKNHSSRVAAGIFNPVTGRNLVKTWRAEKIWPAFYSFYQYAEALLKQSFFHELPQYRPFRAVQDVNDFMTQEGSKRFGSFLDSFHDHPEDSDIIKDPFGGILFAKSGYLDVNCFLDSVRTYLDAKGSFVEDQVKYEIFRSYPETREVLHFKSNYLIYCDGWHGSQSPHFSWLPFRPVKGEVLTIRPEKRIDRLINRGVFVLPQNGGDCVVGSTYDHDSINSIPTQSGRNYLESKLKELIRIPYQVVGHRAGIRPTTLDRRPFVGIHPKFETIGILNGLGTKGVSLAPYFADELIRFIEKRAVIDSEANISRYKSLYL